MDISNYIGLNYHLKKLDTTSREYKLVKEFYDVTCINSKEIYCDCKVLEFQVCKVIENKPMEAAGSNNMMLFHGTSKNGVQAVLNGGFKNSERGWFGRGLYMTESSYIAYGYTYKHNGGLHKADNFIFVNEVLESEKLQTFVYNSPFDIRENDSTPSNAFNKHVRKESPQIELTEENYKKDLEGRQYRNVAIHGNGLLDEFVAEASVTIPRYLIIIKTEKSK